MSLTFSSPLAPPPLALFHYIMPTTSPSLSSLLRETALDDVEAMKVMAASVPK